MNYVSTLPELMADYGRLPGTVPAVTAAPIEKPSMLSGMLAKVPGLPQANTMMGKVGGMLNDKNQALIKALAQAGNIASIYGGPYDASKGDTRFQQIAQLVSGGAAGSALAPKPAPAAPAGNNAPVSNADTNQNGIPDIYEKTTTIKEKIPTRTQQLGSFAPNTIGAALSGNNLPFSNSAGEQAGTPVAAAPVPAPIEIPSVQNLNTAVPSGISNEAQNLQDIGMLLGPEKMMEVYKQKPVQMAAEANMIEARLKEAQLPATLRKMAADTMKAEVDAADTEAKLYGLFQYSPYAQQEVERAKAMGKSMGEQVVVNQFSISELGQLPLPKELQKLQPGAKTYGDIAVMSGSMDGVHKLMELYNGQVVAKINSAGRVGAADKIARSQQLVALGQIETSLGQEQRALMSELTKRESPSFALIGTPQEKATNIATVAQLKKQLTDVNTLLKQNREASTTIRGVETKPVEPDSTNARTGYTKEATEIKGYKIPANSDWKVLPSGKVLYKTRG
jgi:hypothetical protein